MVLKHLPITLFPCNFEWSKVICVLRFPPKKVIVTHSARSGDSTIKIKTRIDPVYLDQSDEFSNQVVIHYMGQPKWWIFTTWVRFIIWVRTYLLTFLGKLWCHRQSWTTGLSVKSFSWFHYSPPPPGAKNGNSQWQDSIHRWSDSMVL